MPMMPVLLYNSPIEKYRTLVIGLKICLIKIPSTEGISVLERILKRFAFFKNLFMLVFLHEVDSV